MPTQIAPSLSRLLSVGAFALLAIPCYVRPSRADDPPASHLAAATQHPLATRAAVAVLKNGGHAVDAAIAAAVALGVVEPDCSGLGGGGFALVWDSLDHRMVGLDFRESAPARLQPAALEREVTAGRHRGALVGVPGELAGLLELHRRYGRKSFESDLEQGIEVAEDGYTVSDALARNAYEYRQAVHMDAALRALFELGPGQPVWSGSAIRRPKLAATLRKIGAAGRQAFYEGAVAQEIEDAVQATGGKLTKEDLAAYHVVERQPIQAEFAGATVFTMPPPSAGGVLLLETLKTNRPPDLSRLGLGSAPYVHQLAQTFRWGMADRIAAIGDPAFSSTNVAQLLDDKRIQARRAQLYEKRIETQPTTNIQEHGTSHLVIVDPQGNAVSMTTTIGDAFGARVTTATTGIILNDELVDFTTVHQYSDFLAHGGVIPDHTFANAPRPGARPVSSMTPAIALRNGSLAFAIGGAGGLRIPTAVTEALLANQVFGKTPLEAVSMARFHTPFDRAVLQIEPGTPANVLTDLRNVGEHLDVQANFSAVQMAVATSPGDGTTPYEAAADSRYGGSAFAQ